MANSKKMLPEEAIELQSYADAVHEHDHLTGRALRAIVYHLAHAHGVDVAEAQDKISKKREAQLSGTDEQTEDENETIERERAEIRKNMGDPEKAMIPVPLSDLPSQQEKAERQEKLDREARENMNRGANR